MPAIRILIGAVLLLVLAGAASSVQSQEKAGSPAPQSFPYSPDSEITLQGKIEQVKEYRCPVTGTVGSHITVAAEGTLIEVHLAPAAFLKDYDIVLKAGDQVKVQGVKITFQEKPAMLARSVSVERETFLFRDQKGKPLW